jgi:hypothetical protein
MAVRTIFHGLNRLELFTFPKRSSCIFFEFRVNLVPWLRSVKCAVNVGLNSITPRHSLIRSMYSRGNLQGMLLWGLFVPCHYVDGHRCKRGSIYTREVDRWRRRWQVLARQPPKQHPCCLTDADLATDSRTICALNTYCALRTPQIEPQRHRGALGVSDVLTFAHVLLQYIRHSRRKNRTLEAAAAAASH